MTALRSMLSLSSVRVRLTLWNVAVLALVLLALGALLRDRVQANLIGQVDQALIGRGKYVVREWERDRQDDGSRLLLPPTLFGADNMTMTAWRILSSPGRPSRMQMVLRRAARDRDAPPMRLIDAQGRDVATGAEGTPLDPAGFHAALQADATAGFTTVERTVDASAEASADAAGGSAAAAAAEPLTGILATDLPPALPASLPAPTLPAASPSPSAGAGPKKEMVRVYTLPLREETDGKPGATQMVYQTEMPLAPVYEEVGRLTRTLLALAPLGLLIAGLGGAFLTDRALRPVRAVTRAAARTQAADLSTRLEVRGGDEFSELARTFNGMLERLQTAFTDLERAYEQQQRFVADASHELKTPLTVIKANTTLALADKNLSAADYREALEAVDTAADRTSRIVQDLFLLARSDAGQLPVRPEDVSIGDILDSVAAEARLVHSDGARVVVEAPAGLRLHADPHLLHRVISNLVENAVRHTPETGRVTLSARAAGDGAVDVEVADTGEGIPPEHLPHVTDRFYRVDAARARNGAAGGGTGLGLPIARAIVEAHGGRLTVASQPGQGTVVRVELPSAGPSSNFNTASIS